MTGLLVRMDVCGFGDAIGVTVKGQGAPRLSCTSDVGFDGLDGEVSAITLDLLGPVVSIVTTGMSWCGECLPKRGMDREVRARYRRVAEPAAGDTPHSGAFDR